MKPTATPTVEPTAEPTSEPTAMPTAELTATPTAEPTAMPTAMPTQVTDMNGMFRSGETGYKNATLVARNFRVIVFLPPTSPDDNAYYNSTRFDWSSQIGNIQFDRYLVYADNFWRGEDHNPSNPEAGVGLSGEFG